MGTRGIAHEEQTYDEVLEMSESAPPVNVRNKTNLYQGPANVKNTHDLYDDLHLPQSNGFKRNVIRWLKGVAVVTVVNSVVVIAVIKVLGIREGTDMFEKNGGWSVWSLLTDCSATCDTGVQTRQRQCNNPVPSSGGQYCKGSAMDVNLCNREHCSRMPVFMVVNTVVLIAIIIVLGIREGTDMLEKNGGWSVWSVWTDCSATCDTGVQTRQRQCNNPVPSSGGQYCEGSPMDVVHCNKQQCPRSRSSFTAKSASRLSTGILSFPSVLLKDGSNFDGDSGTFTCQHSGLYFFTVSVVEGGNGTNRIDCNIRLNNSDQIRILYQNGKESTGRTTTDGYGAATGSAIFHLTNGDRVYVYCFSYTSSVFYSSFTGFLIAEDP